MTWAIDRWEFTRLNEAAARAFEQGRYEEAQHLQNEAIEVINKYGDEHSQILAVALNNLAVMLIARDDLVAAGPLLRQVLEIRRATVGVNHPDYAWSLSKLGSYYLEVNDLKSAKHHFQTSLAIRRNVLRADDPTMARNVMDLAMVHYQLGEYRAAEPLVGEALERESAAPGPNYINALSLMAGIHKRGGAFKRARELYERVLELTPADANALNNLAVLHDDLGEYERAEPLYGQALGLLEKSLPENHPGLRTGLTNLAELYAATGRVDDALKIWPRVLAVVDQMLELVFSLGSETHRAEFVEDTYGPLYSFLSLVLEHCSNSSEVVGWALDVILRRKAIGAEALAAQRDMILGGHYPELVCQLEELNDLRMRVARKTLEGPEEMDPEKYHKQLREWTVQREGLEANLAGQIPEMSLARQLAAADRWAVARALPSKSVLIEFVHFEPFDAGAVASRGDSRWKDARYLAFVMLAEEPDQVEMVDLGVAGPIDFKIAQLRAAITGESGEGTARHLVVLDRHDDWASVIEAGTALREAIFDPLASSLSGYMRLIVSPDGDLSRVPFEVLPLGEDHYLIDEYHISYVSCGRDVMRFEALPNPQSGEPLVLADPDFDLEVEDDVSGGEDSTPSGRQSRDLDRSQVFGRLPGTLAEGEEVASTLGVSPWIAGEALEARLKACRSPRVLHLATHGFFLANQERTGDDGMRDRGALPTDARKDGSRLMGPQVENPLLRSGLALAGANTWLRGGTPPAEAEDGILTAEDVSGLDLLATELVVLSACETGMGEIRTGEGVFGLRRAFALAGARTLIMSLWKVPDRETRELITEFYQRVLNGQSRSEALREAQLAAKAKYGHPLYWGAFICEGHPGPLSQSG